MYFDSSALFFFFRYSKEHTDFIRPYFQQLHDGQLSGLTSSLTLDELYYTLLMRLIEQKYSKHPTQVICDNPMVVSEFSSQLKQVNETLLSFNNLKIVEADLNIVGKIPILMEKHNLLPRDCIHLQTMLNHNENQILTTDSDFDNIAGIIRVSPEQKIYSPISEEEQLKNLSDTMQLGDSSEDTIDTDLYDE